MRASIIIPSLGRGKALQKCLQSLKKQTVKPYEVIVESSEGPLAKIRNKAAARARGDILCFVDDDIVASSHWLEGLLKPFDDKNVAGVSGPSIITKVHRRNRDIFRYGWIKRIYDRFFLEGRAHLPGRITQAGVWTTGACDRTCKYEGEVDFLEACNMAFRRKVFRYVKGFDEHYGGVGDWSEPDLAFRIRKLGHKLWFANDARLYHRPSRQGAYKKRRSDAWRLKNYYRFSDRWVKPHWKNEAYKAFLKTYYFLKRARLA